MFGKGGKFKVKLNEPINMDDPKIMESVIELNLKYTIWKKYLKH
jgi:hypothetical protein